MKIIIDFAAAPCFFSWSSSSALYFVPAPAVVFTSLFSILRLDGVQQCKGRDRFVPEVFRGVLNYVPSGKCVPKRISATIGFAFADLTLSGNFTLHIWLAVSCSASV